MELSTDEAPEPDTNKGKNPAAVSLGRLGGENGGVARAKALSQEQRKELTNRAAQTRWEKS